LLGLFILLIVYTILTACGNGENDSSSASGSESESADTSDSNDAQGEISGQIVTTTFGGEWNRVISEAADGFMQKHPDSEVVLDVGLSLDWIAKIKATNEGSAPPIDVMMAPEFYGNMVRNMDKAVDFEKDKI